jgi:hypothetical protein
LDLRGRSDILRMFSPLAALRGTKVPDLEDQSLRADEQFSIFVLCDRVPGFDQDLNRFLAMREVVNAWNGDPHKSEEAHKLAIEREANDLDKLDRRVRDAIKTGIRQAHVIFRGSSRRSSQSLRASPTPTSSVLSFRSKSPSKGNFEHSKPSTRPLVLLPNNTRFGESSKGRCRASFRSELKHTKRGKSVRFSESENTSRGTVRASGRS